MLWGGITTLTQTGSLVIVGYPVSVDLKKPPKPFQEIKNNFVLPGSEAYFPFGFLTPLPIIYRQLTRLIKCNEGRTYLSIRWQHKEAYADEVKLYYKLPEQLFCYCWVGRVDPKTPTANLNNKRLCFPGSEAYSPSGLNKSLLYIGNSTSYLHFR